MVASLGCEFQALGCMGFVAWALTLVVVQLELSPVAWHVGSSHSGMKPVSTALAGSILEH